MSEPTELDWERQEYIAEVLTRILQNNIIEDKEDLVSIYDTITRCFNWGMTKHDAYRFTRCTEEVNPNLPEDTACQRMKMIMDNYDIPKKGK